MDDEDDVASQEFEKIKCQVNRSKYIKELEKNFIWILNQKFTFLNAFIVNQINISPAQPVP